MTPVENSLLAALVQLDATVKSMATAKPKPNLLPLFKRLDDLTEQLPRDTDPALLHYLHKKSYEKARFICKAATRKINWATAAMSDLRYAIYDLRVAGFAARKS